MSPSWLSEHVKMPSLQILARAGCCSFGKAWPVPETGFRERFINTYKLPFFNIRYTVWALPKVSGFPEAMLCQVLAACIELLAKVWCLVK